MAKNDTVDPFDISKFSELERLCLKAKGKHLTDRRALVFIINESDGRHKISRSTYYRTLAKIRKKIPELEDSFAESGLSDRHFIRKNTFDEIIEEMWTQYYTEDEPLKKTSILAQIANMEQLNSIADSDTILVIEKQNTMKIQLAQKKIAEKEAMKKSKEEKKDGIGKNS